ncbi:DUF6090 family protein [Croceitalea rosinachiae]|uniref:DUF6090 family protein n=1 Tax=Croceitalea rosinachiae TaxID=3075596 RepID=A0ABU3A868_9FLAO|nr:DUF6090 family protein [Croceitalea sp. F388]MDT0605990.1 DUF6090 family protein [Croceitalea sp. F388]
MIKFFRHIRQKLLAENKFRKYLLYAIGEIVLVVIGILLALQINAWSTNKNERAKEQLYLRSFQNDIEVNLSELERVIEKSGFTISATDSLLRYAVGEITIEDFQMVEDLIMESANYTIFLSQEGTINDIFGSGDLALIQNESIRKSMVNWVAKLKYLREYESLGKNSQLQFINYLESETPFYKLSLQNPFIDKETNDKLMYDQLFLNLVGNQKHMATVLNGLYKETISEMDKLLTKVSSSEE